MKVPESILSLGLTQYEVQTYLALLEENPVNGSQLSRRSGVPRARIYDVLQSLADKGLVVEVSHRRWAPLPPDELFKRLQHNFDTALNAFKDRIEAAHRGDQYDFIWTVKGYDDIIKKASGMIAAARDEIYTRLYPYDGQMLAEPLDRAGQRGVTIKYVSMGPPPIRLFHQVVHPEPEGVADHLGGRSFDLVVDRQEVLVGLIEKGRQENSRLNWARNHWFVIATRDSLRHDFFHYFLHKIHEEQQDLSPQEEELYRSIVRDY